MARLSKPKKTLIIMSLSLVLSSCAGGGFLDIFKPVSIKWNDTSWCTPIELKFVLFRVAKKFGPITVHSTHRWPLENARKGGKKKSMHLTCRAVDFSVKGGTPSEIKAYLKAQWEVGGYSYYAHKNFFHIDNGKRRTW